MLQFFKYCVGSRRDSSSESPIDNAEQAASAADTDVSVPAVANGHSIETAVRARIEHTRAVSAAALGVRPVFVPSFREDATRARLRAETLADGFPADAIEAWKEYLVFCPRDASAWFAFGEAWMRCEDATMALAAFEKVVELDRQHGLAFGMIGHIRHFFGQLEEAIIAYETAHRLRPHCSDMATELLRLYEATHRSSKADALRDVYRQPASRNQSKCTMTG